jgi:hypothetical protein
MSDTARGPSIISLSVGSRNDESRALHLDGWLFEFIFFFFMFLRANSITSLQRVMLVETEKGIGNAFALLGYPEHILIVEGRTRIYLLPVLEQIAFSLVKDEMKFLKLLIGSQQRDNVRVSTGAAEPL